MSPEQGSVGPRSLNGSSCSDTADSAPLVDSAGCCYWHPEIYKKCTGSVDSFQKYS